MSAVGIIPARYASSRFPGKALAKVAGVPLVQRVWEGARGARELRDVVIATDDDRIAECCRGFGASVRLTRADHPSGSDRIAEVAAELDDEIVVNIQGDEVLIAPSVIDAAVEALRGEPDAAISTLIHRAGEETLADPNRVKVVTDRHGFALTFSRAPLVARIADDGARQCWQHVGLYAYRRDALLRFVGWPPSPLERSESLEQLRALENGERILCVEVEDWQSLGVDVPEDIGRAEAALRAMADGRREKVGRNR